MTASSSARVPIPAQVLPTEDAFLSLTERATDKPAYVYGKIPHVLGGVIACGYCREIGLSFADSVMSQYAVTKDGVRRGKGVEKIPAIKCWGGYKKTGDAQRHPIFALGEHRIEAQWNEYVTRITALPIDAKHLALWLGRSGGAPEIAQADQMEAAIRAQRTLILARLGGEWDEAVARQVRAALRDLDADDQKLQALKAKSRERPVDEAELRGILKRYASVYADADPKTKNGLNRALVAALGSLPTVKRFGELGKGPGMMKGAEPIFAWPEVDAILEAAA